MFRTVFVFSGAPSTWKFFAIHKLHHLLKWSGFEVDLISDVVAQDGRSLRPEGLDDYAIRERSARSEAPVVIFDTVLYGEEARITLQEEISKRASTAVFIDWRVPSTETQSILPLTGLLSDKEKVDFASRLTPLLKKTEHVRHLTDKEGLENAVTVTVSGPGNRHLSAYGMQTPSLQRILRFFWSIQPGATPPVMINQTMVAAGNYADVMESVKGKTTAIFSSTEAWATLPFEEARLICKHPRGSDVRDITCNMMSCLDEKQPDFNLIGLTEEEIQVRYVENTDLRASLKEQKLCTDLMTRDQVERILMNAHEKIGEVFERKKIQLKREDYWPLISDMEASGNFSRLLICSDDAHQLLSEYFLQ